ncbi:MAG TPA: phospholipase D family protein [Caldimonas sp.]|nr:phospholipase D family protein [Caldimonas sp.]
MIIGRIRRASVLLALQLLLAGCAGLPPRPAEPPTLAIAPGNETTLQRVAVASTRDFLESGFQLLPVATASLEARLALAARAEKTLDLQYFEWSNDPTGRYLLKTLRLAAERGVRVRVLVDDLHSSGADTLLAGLAAFDNAQVRLFNPFVRNRGSLAFKLASSLDDLGRVNHRMHNKMFVADNALAVFGGRNIADEYFMRATTRNFIDLDILAAGPIVQALSASFDIYWNSEYSYPIEAIVQPGATTREARRAAFIAALETTGPPPPDRTVPPRYAAYVKVPADLDAGRIRLVPAHGELRADPIDKIAGTRVTERTGTVRAFVGEFTRAAQQEVVAISPYFVLGKAGMETAEMLGERGVRMRVLTNSLAATDEAVVHGGYQRYVVRMLQAGIEVFELSPSLARQSSRLGRFGDTSGMLHAKIIVVDRARLFITSLNLDGRSERYNTEIGVLIDSGELAEDVLDMLDFEGSSYQLRLAPGGDGLEWISGSGERQKVYKNDPEASFWSKFKASLIGRLLPENWL